MLNYEVSLSVLLLRYLEISFFVLMLEASSMESSFDWEYAFLENKYFEIKRIFLTN